MFCEILPLCNFPASLPVSHSASPLLLHCCHSAFIRHARPQSGVNTANEIEIISGARTCWCKSVIVFCCFVFFAFLALQGSLCQFGARALKGVRGTFFFKFLVCLFFCFGPRADLQGTLNSLASRLLPSPTSRQAVQAELDARRSDWALSLDQLAQYTDSLEKELIKMASNMRRSRTEILHLSVRWAPPSFLFFFLRLFLCCFVSLTLGTKVAEPPARGSVF